MDREPAVTVGTIGAAVSAVIVLLIAFGVPISDEQQQALVGVVAVLVPLVVGLATRRFVWAPASVQRAVTSAVVHHDDEVPETGAPS